MRNAASQLLNSLSLCCLLLSIRELSLLKTDWMMFALLFTSCFTFFALSLIIEYILVIDTRIAELTRVLTDTFTALSKSREVRQDPPGIPPGSLILSFKPGEQWIPMDHFSLDDLERQRLEAEKHEDYERAAKIQLLIDKKKAGGR